MDYETKEQIDEFIDKNGLVVEFPDTIEHRIEAIFLYAKELDNAFDAECKECNSLRAENAELKARLDKALDDMRTVTVTDINMRDLMELADRLDAQGQHPGFPRLQPTQEMVEDWLPFTEAANRLIERMLTLD